VSVGVSWSVNIGVRTRVSDSAIVSVGVSWS